MAKAAESNKPSVTLSHDPKFVSINNLPIDNQLVYEYFVNKVSSDNYVETMQKAINIGVLALVEDKFSAFLVKTKNEVQQELETLKTIYDMKIQKFTETNEKGTIAEISVYQALLDYITENNFNDDLELTGNKGAKGKNKTGDLVATFNEINKKVAIEVKINKSVTLGDFNSDVVKFLKTPKDTAISQILESKYNRDAEIGIFVYDKSALNDVAESTIKEGIKYYSGIGFVVIIDILSNDYKNLFVAYLLSRDMAYNGSIEQVNNEWINLFLENFMNDFKNIIKLKDDVNKIKSGLNGTIKACDSLIENVNKNIATLEDHYNYFRDFIKNGDRDSKAHFTYLTGRNLNGLLEEINKQEQE
jgi:hypothetical protein